MWQVAEAKNRFSELLTKALREGPQRIRRRGEEVVVVSAAEWDRLRATRPLQKPKMSLGEYILNGPSLEGVDLERVRSPMRDVDLE